MGKAVMGTEFCYEATDYLEDGEPTINGSYSDLSEIEGVEDTEIQFSESCWDSEKEYFEDFLNEVVRNYEKRYRTTITHFALAGTVGIWNGRPIGGRFIRVNENPLEKMGNVDDVEVYIEDDGEITILGHHHDGSHRMGIYLINEKLYDKLEDQDYQAFEWIFANRKPITEKQAKGYFANYQSEQVA